ncbi:putative aminopeptidase [Bernardetia litoralis DSM 6794]|uniref:Putative aminopeptidase n=1 Tax=Bernardetia litoralis (strain ATCC 23117 / DSM 6794 / NBRC 15988 / NCIMB 1366 / Fx l1 / Sio-4) TaxID=880071 RepID=I4AKF1_BERLS|nr:M28 family peptidase [Bernardetia litoralis]AFM04436.1 putative aminopeptidase [Bernardetia litoralis DSM 6794]
MFKNTIPKIVFSVLLLIFSSAVVQAQQKDSLLANYLKYIDEVDMKKHLSILASDEYEGRNTGEKGQKMAAKYLANRFKELGLTAPVNGSYLQKFELDKTSLADFKIETLTGKIELSQNEIIVVNPFQEDKSNEEYNIIFAGYGVEEEGDNGYSSYKSINVKDKIAVIIMGTPKGKESLIPNEDTRKSVYLQMNFKKKLAEKKGAKGVIFVTQKAEYTLFDNMYGHYFKDPKWSIPSKEKKQNKPDFVMALSTINKLPNLLGYTDKKWKKVFKKWNKKNKTVLETKAKVVSTMKIEKVETENVLGYLEGTDKKDELVVLTAHYDHIGIIDGKIYNGADDDGSGTTAILELAEAFAIAKKEGNTPRRSILFMLVTGEEKGLLGSSYYSENPVFPLKNTVSNLNIDMIGRMDKDHEGDPNYIYIIGSTMLSTELHNLSESAAKNYAPNVKLDYTYNDKDDPNRFYYRSDHYNFAKHDIPVIFYFNGVHADYHKHTDTVDKIHFGKMQEITRLVFATAWQLVNREERIKND